MVVDHYISFKYMSAADISRVGRDLKSDPSDASSGWFLRAYSNEGYSDIVKYTRIPPQAMVAIARAIDEVLPNCPETSGKLESAVREANTEHAKRRKQGIEFLEQRIEADKLALERARAEEQS